VGDEVEFRAPINSGGRQLQRLLAAGHVVLPLVPAATPAHRLRRSPSVPVI